MMYNVWKQTCWRTPLNLNVFVDKNLSEDEYL